MSQPRPDISGEMEFPTDDGAVDPERPNIWDEMKETTDG